MLLLALLALLALELAILLFLERVAEQHVFAIRPPHVLAGALRVHGLELQLQLEVALRLPCTPTVSLFLLT